MKFQVALSALALLLVFASNAEAQQVKICEPKSVFMDDCNRCRCSDDGFDKSCTRIMCIKKPEGEAGRAKRDAEDENCEPGSKFNISCNECICTDAGKKASAACTLKACLEDQVEERTRRDATDSEFCTPGSHFKIDCNECICPSSGIRAGAACTLKACF